jgi:hypothetical protein
MHVSVYMYMYTHDVAGSVYMLVCIFFTSNSVSLARSVSLHVDFVRGDMCLRVCVYVCMYVCMYAGVEPQP